VVVHQTTVVHVDQITVYGNARVPNAVVVVNQERFGHGPIQGARVAPAEVRHVRPTHAAPRVATTPAHFAPTTRRGLSPPEDSLRRPVVATRPAPRARASAGAPERRGPGREPLPAPRLVPTPSHWDPAPVVSRPPVGTSPIERPAAGRHPSPPPPRTDAVRHTDRPPAPHQAPSQRQPSPTVSSPPVGASPQPTGRAAGPPARPEREPPPAPPRGAPGARGARGPDGPPAAPHQPSGQPPGGRPAGGSAPGASPTAAPQPGSPPASVSVPAPAGPTAPGSPGRREATPPVGRPLAGEPATRVAPTRGESRAQQPETGDEARPQPDRPRGGRGSSARERPGE